MADDGFYRDLPAAVAFAEAIDTRAHVDLPDDWWVAIADVVDSTQAIADGAYKKVNTVGVACIAAIANLERSLELPFVFGGDGATFALPERLRAPAIVALRGAQRLAAASFGLQLRAGLVRVGDLRRDGHWVRIGKLALSPLVSQPLLSGRGWDEAERRVKGEGAGVCRVDPDGGPAQADFSGFECRWQNVPSFRDVKLALIVVATAPEPAVNQATYGRVLAAIDEIFGDLGAHHPLRAQRLQLAFAPRALAGETLVRTVDRGFWAKTGYALRILLQNLAGCYLFARGIDTRAVRWSRYRDDLVANTDFRKFDGALRMVVDASQAQIAALQARLAAEQAAGALAWGMHSSREALITCLVESHAGRHLHFVDGSDGGYALAARQLKTQLAAARPPQALS
ncbi:DUF3095 domain-containing protein [Azonexus fungiphilus]|uniref:DUF3095 domain-containing protein n=1 Tax=Azonexus fungiphilus TaxID=146940 RepID=UPI00156AEE0A|nr:DUF3095 domain-containing protein [Azonexus fungiphilus]NHC05664.1 DUF3095 domain-containing protein [Azonexus fungiphilus]